MLTAKTIYIKDKQAFAKDGGILRLIGKPVDIAKQWQKEGVELLHVIDLDALNGSKSNFDIYDKLTYLMHVEIECGENAVFVKQLLAINARVVIALPAKIDLTRFASTHRLLVGKIKKDYTGSVDEVYDLLIEGADAAAVKRFAKLGKRVIVHKADYKKTMEKLVFALLD